MASDGRGQPTAQIDGPAAAVGWLCLAFETLGAGYKLALLQRRTVPWWGYEAWDGICIVDDITEMIVRHFIFPKVILTLLMRWA